MSLTFRFWGTRGSIPAPGAHTVRYGGNTPCVEVRTSEGGLVILDAGTGIRELGRRLVEGATANDLAGEIFLTHAHWDHVQGLPFFAPLFRAQSRFVLWAPPGMLDTVTRAVRQQMSPGVFPVTYDELGGTLEIRALPEEGHRGRGYQLDAFPVQHPGGGSAYRLSGGNRSRSALVYISDNELAGGHGAGPVDGWRARLAEFARGATALVHDATYTVEEYGAKRGWGHSTDLDALELALEAEVETLVLFHHAPERTDEQVDERVAACAGIARERGAVLRVVAAAEGMEITI
jgi:phosphoribosyl 1,2-cyclic phosphodiesterase